MSHRKKARARPAQRAAAALLAAAMHIATPAAAQDVMARSGDWEYGSDAELAAASTMNAEGSMFGLVCSPSCIAFIETDQPCEPGRAYDGTMTSPGRADPMQIECRPVEGRFALLFTPNEAFIATLSNGPDVIVSVRVGAAQNRVFRFSLVGAFDAVYVTLATALAASGDTPETADPGL